MIQQYQSFDKKFVIVDKRLSIVLWSYEDAILRLVFFNFFHFL